MTIRIIRNGELLETYNVESPFRVLHSDDSIVADKSYYRLEIKGSGVWLVTNPIFVNVGDAHEIRKFEQTPAPTAGGVKRRRGMLNECPNFMGVP